MENTPKHPDELVFAPSNNSPLDDGDTGYDIFTEYVGNDGTYALVSRLRQAQRAQWNLSEEVRRLRAEVVDTKTAMEGQLAELRQQLQAAMLRHHRDIEIIGERLIQEANDRDWCDVYDRVVDEINSRLSVELADRQKPYDVSGTWEITVSVPFTRTVTARNEDEAAQIVADWDVSKYDMEEAFQSEWGFSPDRSILEFQSEDINDISESDY